MTARDPDAAEGSARSAASGATDAAGATVVGVSTAEADSSDAHRAGGDTTDKPLTAVLGRRPQMVHTVDAATVVAASGRLLERVPHAIAAPPTWRAQLSVATARNGASTRFSLNSLMGSRTDAGGDAGRRGDTDADAVVAGTAHAGGAAAVARSPSRASALALAGSAAVTGTPPQVHFDARRLP